MCWPWARPGSRFSERELQKRAPVVVPRCRYIVPAAMLFRTSPFAFEYGLMNTYKEQVATAASAACEVRSVPVLQNAFHVFD